MRVVFDIETDSLDATVIHVVVAKELGKKGNYIIRSPKAFAKFAKDGVEILLLRLWQLED